MKEHKVLALATCCEIVPWQLTCFMYHLVYYRHYSTASRHSIVPLVLLNTCGAYTHVLHLQQAQHKITLINCTTECVASERSVCAIVRSNSEMFALTFNIDALAQLECQSTKTGCCADAVCTLCTYFCPQHNYMQKVYKHPACATGDSKK
jgi:hypothetical protein